MSAAQFTVGKVDAGMAILLTDDHHLIEFPSLLLPDNVTKNSIVNISVTRNEELERTRMDDFWKLQSSILSIFGTDEPEKPQIEITNITQTSLILKWQPLILHTAKLRSLDIYKNSTKMTQHLPDDLNYIKLSGLEMDQEYEFHVVMKTTCGNYESNTVKALTHTLNNLTGICVTFGTFHDGINLPEIKELVEKMGASYTEEIGIETTHLIAQVPGGSNYDYAVEHSIPVVKPDWVVQCDRNKKIQPVRPYYVDSVHINSNNNSISYSDTPTNNT